MKLAELPQSKTYPAVGCCIYCGTGGPNLSDEHIMPRALGGNLVLPKSSCNDCAEEIKRYEASCMNYLFIQARTFLKLPMYKPKYRLKNLRLGAFRGEETFPNLTDNFRWQDVPVQDHPASIYLPRFSEPGLLRRADPTEKFEVVSLNYHSLNGMPPSHIGVSGERSGNFIRWSPDEICKMVAKIAHGAAWAELGESFFKPITLELIRNKSPYGSYYVGSVSRNNWPRTNSLHRITLHLDRGHVVARVNLFSAYGFPPFLVVIGAPSDTRLYHYWNSVSGIQIRHGWRP